MVRLMRKTIIAALMAILPACSTSHPTNDAPSDPDAAGDQAPSVSPDAASSSSPAADPNAPPPAVEPPKCGASGVLCVLGEACGANADCATGLCVKSACESALSCSGAKGANQSCGGGRDDCCASIAVPGGAFTNVDNDVDVETASVPPFKLDKFEVSVGRFRAFVAATGGDLRTNHPVAGSGEKATRPGSGWRSSFNARLPGSKEEVDMRLTLACAEGGNNLDYGAATWTPEPGPNEAKPINCVDWYSMFAFCVWDGGRLPTDAEWSYVALSGDEGRVYPYGNEAPTWTTHHLIFASRLPDPATPGTSLFTQGPLYRSADDGPLPIAPVGLKAERSKWGHADLTGNVIEMTMEKAQAMPNVCADCANVAWPDPPQVSGYPRDWKAPGPEFSDAAAVQDGIRLGRGSSWQGEAGGHWMKNSRNRFWLPVWRTYSALGARCARDL